MQLPKPHTMRMVFLTGITLLVISCQNKNPFDVDLSDIRTDAEIHQFEEDLMSIPDTLFFKEFPKIYPRYERMMHGIPPDSLLMTELLLFRTDPNFLDLYHQKSKILGTMDKEIEEIRMVLRYYKYHFPEAPEFLIYTQFSGIDPQTLHVPVVVTEEHLGVISTDLFLGSDFEPYQSLGIPEYKRKWMTPRQIAPEFARQLAFLHAGSPSAAESLLEQMVFYGKVLVFMDAMLPNTPDSLKIKYTEDQLIWCEEHQRNVWAYLVNNRILYSSEPKQGQMFMQESPFTSVFTEQSPGRIGQWLGWQMVRKYMQKNPETSLSALMEETDAQKILTESGYKPR